MSDSFKNIKNFTIYSNYSGEISLTGKGSFTHLTLYQSLLDDSVRGHFTMADTGYRTNGGKNTTSVEEDTDIKLTTGERVKLVLNDNRNNEIDIELSIENVNYSSSSTMTEMFSISLCSNDFIKMQYNKSSPNKHFEGKIHEIVKKVLTNHLETEQNIHVHPTLNTLPINGYNNDNPLDFCTALAPKSIPEDYPDYSGYFFYNTIEGYHFKSIDKLFMQPEKRKMIYNETTKLPSSYTNKIIKATFHHNMNVSNILQTASLTKSKIETFDPFTNEYVQNEWDSNETYGDNNAANEKPKVASHLDAENEATKIINQIYNTGVLPPGSNLEKQLQFSREPTFDLNEIVRKSIARYNQAFLYRAEIVIPGDFGIYPGDIVRCHFPEISSKDLNKEVSRKKSGKYLVCDVSHFISAEHCYTRLNIVRDSIME